MKIVLAGAWQWTPFEPSFAEALTTLGHDVVPFSFEQYFAGRLGRYQEAVPLPAVALWRLNHSLLALVRSVRPDVVLLWRTTHVLPRTVRRIRQQGVVTVSHNIDDPFAPAVAGLTPWHHRLLWMWYRRCLQEVDLTIVNRQVNVEEARRWGARNVHVLRPYFVPARHQAITLSDDDKRRFACDAVFVGHYEADGREEYIGCLVDAGVHVRLFGGSYWMSGVLGRHAAYFGEVSPVHGDDYVKALCGAQVCLGFVSKMNRDTYTFRCFEIPACGGLLLCQRTADLEAMFKDGEEAVFFSSKEELRERASWLLGNPEAIQRIAAAGRRRVYADGHDVVSRAGRFMELVAETSRALPAASYRVKAANRAAAQS